MSASLVGSEMCIRDRAMPAGPAAPARLLRRPVQGPGLPDGPREGQAAVSYTHLTLPTICSV
eukprot:9375026-Alexandrium_andersonii.AAC.1